MTLSKIHHIAIIVSDYEAAKDFYVNKLGFSVIRENYRSERKDWKLDLRVNEYTELKHIGVRPHKEKINISKEIINKTRGAEAPYAAQIFTYLSVVSSRQRLYWRLRCEEATLDRRNRPNEDK